MSLKEKSDRSIKAAEFLQKAELYCSSVHSYHYACFQLMHFQLLNCFDASGLQEQYRKVKSEQTKTVGSHVIYLQVFSKTYRRGSSNINF